MANYTIKRVEHQQFNPSSDISYFDFTISAAGHEVVAHFTVRVATKDPFDVSTAQADAMTKVKELIAELAAEA